MERQSKTIIVPLWSGVFLGLSYISLFALVGVVFSKAKASHLFVDVWVLTHTLGALVVLIIVTRRIDRPTTTLFVVVMAYGFFRVFEIVIYQTNVLLFDEYRAAKARRLYKLRGYRRIVLLLLHNYFEIIFWFAVSYVFAARANIIQIGSETLLSVLRESLLAMVTFSGPTTRPTAPPGALILLSESGVGVFMTIVVLSRFISLLPTPATMDEFETPQSDADGKPTQSTEGLS